MNFLHRIRAWLHVYALSSQKKDRLFAFFFKKNLSSSVFPATPLTSQKLHELLHTSDDILVFNISPQSPFFSLNKQSSFSLLIKELEEYVDYNLSKKSNSSYSSSNSPYFSNKELDSSSSLTHADKEVEDVDLETAKEKHEKNKKSN